MEIRIVRLMVEEIDLSSDRIPVRLRAEDLHRLVEGCAPWTEKQRELHRSRRLSAPTT